MCALRAKRERNEFYYGYNNLSAYIRDACIHEKVTYVDLKNRNIIYKAYSDNTKELKEICKNIRHICTFATQLPAEETKGIVKICSEIYRRQQDMINLIGQKLDLEVWQKRNHTKLYM